jgi:hypothetical protein
MENQEKIDTNTPKLTVHRARNANAYLESRQTLPTHKTGTLTLEQSHEDLLNIGTKQHKATKRPKTTQETEECPSSGRGRLSYGATLLVFTLEELLISDTSTRAITHLLAFAFALALGCHPR